MIHICLNEKEKRILNIAYLDFYCKISSCEKHRRLSGLKKLEEKSMKELDNILADKKLEKLAEKYQTVQNEITEKECSFFRLYGFPLALSDNSMNVGLVKKILLIDIEELTNMQDENYEILEIKFFYCLHLLKKIVYDRDKDRVLNNIEKWYKDCYPVIKVHLGQKKTKRGKFIKISKIINEEEFERKVIINRDYAYFIQLYKKYENVFEKIHDFFDSFFDYKTYFNNINLKYVIASLMKVEVCPYCNRQYISILHEEKRTTLTFDHYKCESVFPLLKLSLYNLVPSCYICNSLFKGINDLEHLYPWKESNGGLSFSYDNENKDVDDLKAFYSMNNCNDVVETKIVINQNLCNEHAINSIKVFKLENVYQIHNHYASMLIAKAMKYEVGGYRKEIFKILSDNNILTDEANLDEYLYGMNFQHNDVDESSRSIPLFKLSSDIVNEIRKC